MKWNFSYHTAVDPKRECTDYIKEVSIFLSHNRFIMSDIFNEAILSIAIFVDRLRTHLCAAFYFLVFNNFSPRTRHSPGISTLL